jgi:hypothetical protein
MKTMSKIKLVILFLSICLMSCSHKNKKFDKEAINPSISENFFKKDSLSGETPIEHLLVRLNPNKDKVFDVAENAVVFAKFTDKELDSLKNINEEEFNTLMDDIGYYQSEAVLKLNSLKIKTLYTDKRYLRYNKPNQEALLIDTRKLKRDLGWHIYFFNNNKKARVIYSVDITSELIKDYFGK